MSDSSPYSENVFCPILHPDQGCIISIKMDWLIGLFGPAPGTHRLLPVSLIHFITILVASFLWNYYQSNDLHNRSSLISKSTLVQASDWCHQAGNHCLTMTPWRQRFLQKADSLDTPNYDFAIRHFRISLSLSIIGTYNAMKCHDKNTSNILFHHSPAVFHTLGPLFLIWLNPSK